MKRAALIHIAVQLLALRVHSWGRDQLPLATLVVSNVGLDILVDLFLQQRGVTLSGELCLNLLLVQVALGAALIHAGLLYVASLNIALREALLAVYNGLAGLISVGDKNTF